MKKSVSSSTSNAFDAGFDEEPDWSLWHYDIVSQADSLMPHSFTTPAVPKLLTIISTMNADNLNEAQLLVTVDKISAGLD
ncbi:hypothetical protein BLNAU_21497 [Blattamonas nauphoetae]|uniref:Uncharacterized protein n=1 Tax=Blattamonas nauphoetae TaxID=2049346 RepID=A0ABQ9WVN8_9EUKA|nr:hypothetical protein BLNAU_21497 [Blattamonas nauphoetae]